MKKYGYYLVKIDKPELFDLGEGNWYQLLDEEIMKLENKYSDEKKLVDRLKFWVYTKEKPITQEEIQRRASSLLNWAKGSEVIVISKEVVEKEYELLDYKYNDLRKFVGICHTDLYNIAGGFN